MRVLEKNCDLFLDNFMDKRKKEYFNEFGYNFSKITKDESHYNNYAKSLANIQKRKPKI